MLSYWLLWNTIEHYTKGKSERYTSTVAIRSFMLLNSFLPYSISFASVKVLCVYHEVGTHSRVCFAHFHTSERKY